jgi:hypothetical protein
MSKRKTKITTKNGKVNGVDTEYRYQPWVDCEKQFKPIEVNIDEPPCKHCFFFNPRVTTDKNGNFAGVIVCTSDDMNHDFSCFKQRRFQNEK